MFTDNLKKLLLLSKNINKIFNDDNFNYTQRIRKITTKDGYVFKLLYSQINTSKQDAARKLNNFYTEKIHRSSYSRRDEQIDVDLYKKIFEMLQQFFLGLFIEDTKIKSKNIYAVDGTTSHLKKKTNDDGFKLNPCKRAVSAMSVGIYDIIHQCPVAMDLVTHKNERGGFLDYLTANLNKFNDSIFILDAGYFGDEFFNKINNLKLFYICRLAYTSSLIPSDSDDKIVETKKGDKRRIITYEINSNKYYLATNLFDSETYSAETLKQLYHSRWDIEEYFKYAKKQFSLGYLNENRKKQISKTIYAQLIISLIVSIIKKINGQHKTSSKQIINSSSLTKAVYDEFICKFFYNKYDLGSIKAFFDLNISYQTTKKGKHYPRIATMRYSKGYALKYKKKHIKQRTTKKKAKKTNKKKNKANIKKKKKPPIKNVKEEIKEELKPKNNGKKTVINQKNIPDR